MLVMIPPKGWRIERCGLGLAVSVTARVSHTAQSEHWYTNCNLSRYWHYIGLPRAITRWLHRA